MYFIAGKPLPTHESSAVGYERIVMEAAKVGEDPLEVFDRDEKTVLAGSGTAADPFVVNSRNKKRAVLYLGMSLYYFYMFIVQYFWAVTTLLNYNNIHCFS